ncbi:MAG: hypothetical protein Q8P60_04535 [Pseudorhodobacter sp.]|nr:hypothetical protein [Pseudorhodobacter sp.]
MKYPLILCLLLAACGTPQENCIAGATRDLRVVDRLILETETNLRRGYALQEVTVFRPVWVDCTPLPPLPVAGQPAPIPRRQMCWDQRPETVTKPKAIDLEAESRKLTSLRAKRKALARQAEAMIADCRLRYPE